VEVGHVDPLSLGRGRAGDRRQTTAVDERAQRVSPSPTGGGSGRSRSATAPPNASMPAALRLTRGSSRDPNIGPFVGLASATRVAIPFGLSGDQSGTRLDRRLDERKTVKLRVCGGNLVSERVCDVEDRPCVVRFRVTVCSPEHARNHAFNRRCVIQALTRRRVTQDERVFLRVTSGAGAGQDRICEGHAFGLSGSVPIDGYGRVAVRGPGSHGSVPAPLTIGQATRSSNTIARTGDRPEQSTGGRSAGCVAAVEARRDEAGALIPA
jgi:hypothetical protein